MTFNNEAPNEYENQGCGQKQFDSSDWVETLEMADGCRWQIAESKKKLAPRPEGSWGTALNKAETRVTRRSVSFRSVDSLCQAGGGTWAAEWDPDRRKIRAESWEFQIQNRQL